MFGSRKRPLTYRLPTHPLWQRDFAPDEVERLLDARLLHQGGYLHHKDAWHGGTRDLFREAKARGLTTQHRPAVPAVRHAARPGCPRWKTCCRRWTCCSATTAKRAASRAKAISIAAAARSARRGREDRDRQAGRGRLDHLSEGWQHHQPAIVAGRCRGYDWRGRHLRRGLPLRHAAGLVAGERALFRQCRRWLHRDRASAARRPCRNCPSSWRRWNAADQRPLAGNGPDLVRSRRARFSRRSRRWSSASRRCWRLTEGWRGLFFNVGWLIDLVTEWTGDPSAADSDAKPPHGEMGGAQLRRPADFVARAAGAAARRRADRLQNRRVVRRLGARRLAARTENLRLRLDWYARHPELYAPPHYDHRDARPASDQPPARRRLSLRRFPERLERRARISPISSARSGAASPTSSDLDALLLRDGLTGPMVYTRNGPYGTSAPADPAQRGGVQPVRARPVPRRQDRRTRTKLVFGYSSAISPVADWRVGCVDFEALVADGFIDGWIEQTWGGAWQDWWHQLWKGWTFQTANLLTRGAMIARANQQRATPCRFYNLIETWDGWEPWDTLHQVPDKLRWAMLGVFARGGQHAGWRSAAGWQLRLVGQQRRAGTAERRGRGVRQDATSTRRRRAPPRLEQVYGWTLVYNRALMAWLSAQHPDWNAVEWIDDQAGLLMKWGVPVLSATRAEWLDALPRRPMRCCSSAGRSGRRLAMANCPGPAGHRARRPARRGHWWSGSASRWRASRSPADFTSAPAHPTIRRLLIGPYLPEHRPIAARRRDADLLSLGVDAADHAARALAVLAAAGLVGAVQSVRAQVPVWQHLSAFRGRAAAARRWRARRG